MTMTSASAAASATASLSLAAETDVAADQFVMMGERIGAMGETSSGQWIASATGADGPTLYIEMREGGIPIDPAGWWASQEQTG